MRRLEKSTLALGIEASAMLRVAYDDMYDLNVGHKPGELESQQSQREAVVQEVFLWILCAKRRLHLNELLQALQAAEDIVTGSKVDGKLLLSLGSNFLRADHSQHVDFVHLSAREYLSQRQSEGRFTVTQKEIHARAARSCLCAMLRTAEPSVNLEIFEAFKKEEANFSSYASTYWPFHFKSSGILDPYSPAERRSSRFPDLKGTMDLYLQSLLKKLPVSFLTTRYEGWSRYFKSRKVQIDHVSLLRLVFTRLPEAISPQDGPTCIALIQCLLALDILTSNTLETPHMATTLISKYLDELVELLLYARLLDSSSATHLFDAARSGSSRVMRMLLQYVSSDTALSARDSDGKNLIEVALAEENFACADILWRVFLEDDDLNNVNDRIAHEYAFSLGRGREERKHFDKLKFLEIRPVDFDSSLCDTCVQLINPWRGCKTINMPSIWTKAKKGCSICSHFVYLWNSNIRNLSTNSDLVAEHLQTDGFPISVVFREIWKTWPYSFIKTNLLVMIVAYLSPGPGSSPYMYQVVCLIVSLLVLGNFVWTARGGYILIREHQPKGHFSSHLNQNIWELLFLSAVPPKKNTVLLQLCHNQGE